MSSNTNVVSNTSIEERKNIIRELSSYLKVAKTNLDATIHLILDIDNTEKESVIHLVRGWKALFAFHQKISNQDNINEIDFESAVDNFELPKLSKLTLEKWKDDLNVFCESINDAPWKKVNNDIFNFENINRHHQILERAIYEARIRLKNHFNLNFWNARRKKFLSIFSIAIISALCASFLIQKLFFHVEDFWKVTYYPNQTLTNNPILELTDNKIASFWQESEYKTTVAQDNFSVRWQTCLNISNPITLDVKLGSDDGSRLLANSDMLINNWYGQEYKVKDFQISLKQGIHLLTLEYFESGGGDDVSFETSPKLSKLGAYMISTDKNNPCEPSNIP